MKMNTLAGGALEVSELCLGSMTWGTQNTEAEGHAQIDMALDHGINFVDTAEMYPTNPLTSERVGNTERIIGSWFEKTGRRGDVVLATKVTGPSPTVRKEGYDGEIIRDTLEASLERLKTDYIDIYQLHWPQRGSYHFRQNWTYDPSGQDPVDTDDHMRDVMETMTEFVDAGKVRHFALSNETAWGTAKWLQIAREMGGPEVVSIQNEYSLLCRLFDLDLAELCMNEGVRCLAYSPLAAGLLTGKYEGGKTVPEGSRMSHVANLGGRTTDRVWPAIDAYLAIAEKHGLDPVHMALAFCKSRPFMGSVIFGATSEAQLQRALGAADVTLSDEVLEDIAKAHKAHPMPY
ncbi:MAG: aldo/keto reductase [Maritimibacter harenae]|jgi:aryl-alcohol dehydrogenase-like predicted oxidoreductase|uniref:Aldo/keto reductase n=1 Tax=Maritimibacter harenae TaxID=2606218 RepID=A0A845LVH7_9RHOB|nr:aldo/keto reductase [Maritimibacter harenae]MZR11815.1 aldo/keto reductase [Maritimibacter harenae]